MQNLNILIVHNYYQIPGGEDVVANNEMKLLKEKGNKVILYTRNNNELKKMSKLKKILLPFNTIFNCKTYFDIKRIIKENSIDIVHVHNTLNLISPAVFYAAKKMKVPVVQTIHNFRMVCPSAMLYRDGHICEDCIKKGLKCAIKYKCYRNNRLQTLAIILVHGIHRLTKIYKYINYICLTEFNKSKLLSFRQIKSEQIFVKPNFSNYETKIIPEEKRKKQMIYVGRLDKQKGVDVLLKYWEGIKDIKLVICGTGPLEEWIKEYIKNNKLTNVEFKGFVDNDKVIKIIAESRALILPTQCYEGFPMTLVESFSVGTPVVCPDLGNAGNIVSDGINGFKYMNNSNYSFNIAIRKCINESEGIYLKTYDLYCKKYNKDGNYKILMNIYSEIKNKKEK